MIICQYAYSSKVIKMAKFWSISLWRTLFFVDKTGLMLCRFCHGNKKEELYDCKFMYHKIEGEKKSELNFISITILLCVSF